MIFFRAKQAELKLIVRLISWKNSSEKVTISNPLKVTSVNKPMMGGADDDRNVTKFYTKTI